MFDIDPYDDFEEENKQVEMIDHLIEYLKKINQKHFNKIIATTSLNKKNNILKLVNVHIARYYSDYKIAKKARTYKIIYTYINGEKEEQFATILKIYFKPFYPKCYSNKTDITFSYDSYEVALIKSFQNIRIFRKCVPDVYIHVPELFCYEMEYFNDITFHDWLLNFRKTTITDMCQKIFPEIDISLGELGQFPPGNCHCEAQLIIFKKLDSEFSSGRIRFDEYINKYLIGKLNRIFKEFVMKYNLFISLLNNFQDDIQRYKRL